MQPGEFIFGVACERDLEGVKRALAEDPALIFGRDDGLGTTALHAVADRGFEEIADVLLEAGADVHARERVSQTTPLHWAAQGGRLTIAKKLVARGADLEAREEWFGLSPLGWASIVEWNAALHGDRPATAAYLREAGAALDVFTALALGSEGDVRAIVGRDPAALHRRMGFVAGENTPLHFAIAEAHGAAVPLLLELGADPAARTIWGLTAMALALDNDDTATVDLLRARGVPQDVSAALVLGDLAAMESRLAGPHGLSPEDLNRLACLAAREGKAEPLALLLRYGAEPDGRVVRSLLDETPADLGPLYLAAQAGHADAVRVLLDAGARVNPDNSGMPTPLHLAAGSGHLDTVRILLDRGADTTARERVFGANPLAWAEHHGHESVAALLRGHIVP
jgi:ankyrin repeat protein